MNLSLQKFFPLSHVIGQPTLMAVHADFVTGTRDRITGRCEKCMFCCIFNCISFFLMFATLNEFVPPEVFVMVSRDRLTCFNGRTCRFHHMNSRSNNWQVRKMYVLLYN